MGFFGSLTSDHPDLPGLQSPMLRIGLSDAFGDSHPNIVEHDIIALIDTGNWCQVDSEMAAKHNLYYIGTVTSRHLEVEMTVNWYKCQILIAGKTFPIQCSNFDFEKNKANFNFVIGMDMIRQFDLTVNRLGSIVALRYLEG